MSSGAMQSNVGNRQIYNDSEQRPHDGAEQKAAFEGGQRNAHDIHDPKDSRTLNRRAQAEKKQWEDEEREEQEQTITNPLAPAEKQGHQPSRGAQVDAELQRDDEEQLKKKGG
ncbi:hypothetical protein CERSUDRAFT_90956 [Gelatoporia subvermispora B]|uniref:Uncharacterized protein n=1 Tax=Ceriporiopsis subvermispora (strain B) TaxID=914234 RepID=M2PZH6_CERS8|nr:hypothetical protein CERSUDRAFT_90956 [Gelatoporia subvermispora B]